MIYALNFADEKFESARIYNTSTAYSKGGIDQVFEYSPSNINEGFKDKYSNILSIKRGAGLWLWKPYFIKESLAKINIGDYLFYCDSGAYYVNSIQLLIDVMEHDKVDVMTFELPLLEIEWTKAETFSLMNCEHIGGNQYCATYILFRKSIFSCGVVDEWLKLCCDEKLISSESFTDIKNPKCFVAHREDQSIWSLLCKKKHIKPYREPSQYGDRPWEYLGSMMYTYRRHSFSNSPYPRIIVSTKRYSVEEYKKILFWRDILAKYGLYNCFVFLLIEQFKLLLRSIRKL